MDTDILIPMGAVLFLLFLSGFFSGSETALTAASKARMTALESEGNERAVLVNRLLERKDRLIGALLLGNNLVNILASALATAVMIELVGDAGVAWATLVMTLLVLIFAEVLPKTFAIQNSDKMALFIAPVIRILVLVLSPVVTAITWIVTHVLRILGIAEPVEADGNEEELRGAIELHRGTHEEIEHERVMLRSILDLGNVEVGEVMIHRRNVAMVDADLPAAEIVEQVLASPHTRLPLYRDNIENIVGVIHAKALLREVRRHDGKLDDLDIGAVASEPWFIPDATTLLDQLHEFRQRREHFAVVIDEYGTFMGIVTLEDILEEIVGDIDDEHDISVEGVKPHAGGGYVVDGTVTVRDLNRQFEWRLPNEHYSTIAGLVLYEAQTIPAAGQKFTFFDFRFEVMERRRNQITRIRVIPPQPQTGIFEGTSV